MKRPSTPVATLDLIPTTPRLAALQAGDRAAIEATLLELLPLVRRWAFRLLGPRADLDDAVQDALTELARSLPHFEGRSSLAGFARRVVVRSVYKRFRVRRPPEVSLELVAPPASELDPESLAMSREVLRRLHRVLGSLSPKRRMAFLLCAVEGLSPTEAALLAGTSAGTMRARLMHARAEVARRLRGDPYVARLLGGSP